MTLLNLKRGIIDKFLSELVKEKKIYRISKGLYCSKPGAYCEPFTNIETALNFLIKEPNIKKSDLENLPKYCNILKNTLNQIHQRCTNPNNKNYKWYGGRGISSNLNFKDLISLWFRDKAYNLNLPSIDRIDNDGNYELSNCRFIELSKNVKRTHN